MKLRCVYCNTLVDIEEELNCPNCGASIGEHEHYDFFMSKKRELDKQKQDADYERKKQQLDSLSWRNEIDKNSLDPNQPAKKKESFWDLRKTNPKQFYFLLKVLIVAMIPIFVFVVGIFGIPIAIMMGEENRNNQQTEVYVEPHHNAVDGEVVSTRYYDVSIDQIGYFTPKNTSAYEKYVKFHFVFTNTSEAHIPIKDIIKCYDSNGKEMKADPWLSDEDKDKKLRQGAYLEPGETRKGWAYFAITEDSTNCEIMFGEKIGIKVSLSEESNLFDRGTIEGLHVHSIGDYCNCDLDVRKWSYYVPKMPDSEKKNVKFYIWYTNSKEQDINLFDNMYCLDSERNKYYPITDGLSQVDQEEMVENEVPSDDKYSCGWCYFSVPKSVQKLILVLENIEISVDLNEDGRWYDPMLVLPDYKIGEIILTDTYELIVNDWEWVENEKKTSGSIRIHINYKNISDEYVYNSYNIHCYDSDGDQYRRFTLSEFIEDEAEERDYVLLPMLKPGESSSGWLEFDIPSFKYYGKLKNTVFVFDKNVAVDLGR